MTSAVAASDVVLPAELSAAWRTLAGFGVAIPAPATASLSDYFKSVKDVLKVLTAAAGPAWVEEVLHHVEYLARKANCAPEIILQGARFFVRQEIVLEAVSNIDSVLRRVPSTLLERVREDLPEEVFALVVDAEGSLANWSAREKALVDARTILQERQDFILKAITNIDAALKVVPGERAEETPAGIPADVFGLILKAEDKLEGWCSREKALLLVRTLLRERPAICLEIGIFGGRSLFPCAAALRSAGAGVIYGIEAWSRDVATENAVVEDNDEWWSKVDFSDIKREFYRFLVAENLAQQVRIIEGASGRAAGLFDQIDFLHIDGSHSMVNATEDVILYARKVRSGGIIVFDDVDWRSTAPAREVLAKFCDPVSTLKDPTGDRDICAVMRRR